MNVNFLKNSYFSAQDVLKKIFIFPIKLYQFFLSPLFPNSCKYYPSCSFYSIQAIQKFGIFKGIAKSFWRLLRCNPFSSGGIDPIEK